MQVRLTNYASIVLLSTLSLFHSMGANPIPAVSNANVVSTALAPDYYPGFANKVLVLGTMHYFEFKRGPNPKAVQPVEAVLEKYQPDVICVEALPPEDIAEMLARGGVDAEVAHQFAGHIIKYGQLLQKYFHVTQLQAAHQAHKLMVSAANLWLPNSAYASPPRLWPPTTTPQPCCNGRMCRKRLAQLPIRSRLRPVIG